MIKRRGVAPAIVQGSIVEVSLVELAPAPSRFALERRLKERRDRQAECLALRTIERRLKERRVPCDRD